MDNKTWITLEDRLKALFIECGLEIETIGVQFNKSDGIWTHKITSREKPKNHPCPECGKELTYYEDGYYWHCYHCKWCEVTVPVKKPKKGKK